MLRASRQLTLFLIAVAMCPSPGRAQNQPEQTTLPAPTQMPAGPVIVNYESGKLTIEALNAPLATVLRAVSNQIGAMIEVPSEADEPVVGTFGPGSPAVVIAALLNGSHFNYTMTASPNDSNQLVTIVLSAQTFGVTSSANKTEQVKTRADTRTTEPRTVISETTISASREQLRAEVSALLEQASAETPREGDNFDADLAGVGQLQKVMEAALARAGALVAASEGRDGNSEGLRTDQAGQNASASRTRHRRR